MGVIGILFWAVCCHQLSAQSQVNGLRIGANRNSGVVIQPQLSKIGGRQSPTLFQRHGRSHISNVKLPMAGDSIDIAMFEVDNSGSITEVDGVRTVQYTAEETLAISEARFYIRKYMGNVLRALTKDFDRVYKSRFCKNEPGNKPLQWKDIRAAATESSRKSSINTSEMRDGQYMKGSKGEAKRLFLRNRLENTLSHYDIPAGNFFRAIDIHAPDWELYTFTDYRPSVAVKQGDGTWLTVETDNVEPSKEEQDPESAQLLEDLRLLRERLESKDKKHFLSATDVIIHLSVLEKNMPKALGVCLKETEDVILKTIPILKKDEERKNVSKERKLKENPRAANPNKKRRGAKAKEIARKTRKVTASGSAGASETTERERGGAPRRRKWVPGTQKVPSYMNQGVSAAAADDNWV